MVKNLIIKDLKETEASYFIVGDDGSEFEVRKKDLGVVTLAVGNQINVIKHPGFPSVVAGLDLLGHRVFHKSREEITDEWMESIEQTMCESLPVGAQHLLKMYEMFVPEFEMYKLAEIAALKLGVELNKGIKAEKLVENFAVLPRMFQKMVLPSLDNQFLPSVPMEKVVLVAKAIAADERQKIDYNDVSQLKDSAVMHLVNATVENYGELCQPRSRYIAEYIEAAAN